MQQRTDIDHIHAPVRRAEIEYRLLKPRLELVALFRLVHVPVVFKIVKDNQIRTVRPVPQPAHTLARRAPGF